MAAESEQDAKWRWRSGKKAAQRCWVWSAPEITEARRHTFNHSLNNKVHAPARSQKKKKKKLKNEIRHSTTAAPDCTQFLWDNFRHTACNRPTFEMMASLHSLSPTAFLFSFFPLRRLNAEEPLHNSSCFHSSVNILSEKVRAALSSTPPTLAGSERALGPQQPLPHLTNFFIQFTAVLALWIFLNWWKRVWPTHGHGHTGSL